jgi:hypothetical protein
MARRPNKSRILHRRKQILLSGLALAGLCGCDYLPYPDKREDPISAAQGFIAAARRDDCWGAWTYFSTETQAKIREQSKRMKRGEPYRTNVSDPERIHCLPYVDYRPSTVRLLSQSETRATVRVMERVPDPKTFALPGFTPIGRMDEPRTLNLTRDTDGWKILPNVPDDPRAQYGEKTYDIGRAIVVTRPPRQRDSTTRSFSVEGTMTMDVGPADLERALADAERWPRFWPQVTSARWLSPIDEHRVRWLSVVFATPDGPREARVFLQQAGRPAEHRSFSFGFGPEHLYRDSRHQPALGKNSIRWAATFSAIPDNGPRGGSQVRWSQSISDSLLAEPEAVAAQLRAFESEARRLASPPSGP